MPQASEYLQLLMQKWFGDPVSDGGPLRFLLARGWTFHGGVCTPPILAHQPSQYELACVEFLCYEWDYGYNGRMDLINGPQIGA